jgi:hypothetical protein
MTSEKRNDLSEIEATPVLAAPSDVDDHYAIYKQHAGEDVTGHEAARVLKKIDRRIIPILFVTYLLQYLDKNGINYASVYGLEDGTHLSGSQYSWLGAWFNLSRLSSKRLSTCSYMDRIYILLRLLGISLPP